MNRIHDVVTNMLESLDLKEFYSFNAYQMTEYQFKVRILVRTNTQKYAEFIVRLASENRNDHEVERSSVRGGFSETLVEIIAEDLMFQLEQ